MTYVLAEPLQRAIFNALTGDPALQALVGTDIYDAPLPLDGKSMPPDYITIGGETVSNRGSKTEPGALHDFDVVVHSNAPGFVNSKKIAGAVCDVLLDAQLTLSRGQLIYLRFLKARADVGVPPARRRISLKFRAFVEDSSS